MPSSSVFCPTCHAGLHHGRARPGAPHVKPRHDAKMTGPRFKHPPALFSGRMPAMADATELRRMCKPRPVPSFFLPFSSPPFSPPFPLQPNSPVAPSLTRKPKNISFQCLPHAPKSLVVPLRPSFPSQVPPFPLAGRAEIASYPCCFCANPILQLSVAHSYMSCP